MKSKKNEFTHLRNKQESSSKAPRVNLSHCDHEPLILVIAKGMKETSRSRDTLFAKAYRNESSLLMRAYEP
ncbi:hypothetical protein H5410_015438 [Solanum commersonii]|uniref:Uncharacterized protein n=1 Tax=Solanum commersonii TaxID=4109 RepID=A0A9J5ZTN7_SOLCO|nr:hypothetical protein H5410_015438 [Solanum commersonii]